MALDIRFILEDNDEENLVDPSGKVLITDGKATIVEPLAFLDAWLDGLITGLKDAQAGRSVNIEVDEPHRVLLEPEGGGVWIKYKDTAVFSETFEKLRNALKIGAEDFLRQIDAIGDTDKSGWIASIRAFANSPEHDSAK